MKKLALIIMFSVIGVVLSAEEYTIQTISTLKENSITPAFEKKVEKSALPSDQKKEGECNIITVGHYKSVKEAHADLKKAKAIAKDAFIRPLVRTTPKVCETHTTAAKTVTATAQKSAAKKEEVVVTSPVVSTVAESAATVIPQETKAVACENSANPVSLYERNLVRKNDIHEAIEYYKTSPFYTFKPVALTQR